MMKKIQTAKNKNQYKNAIKPRLAKQVHPFSSLWIAIRTFFLDHTRVYVWWTILFLTLVNEFPLEVHKA